MLRSSHLPLAQTRQRAYYQYQTPNMSSPLTRPRHDPKWNKRETGLYNVRILCRRAGVYCNSQTGLSLAVLIAILIAMENKRAVSSVFSSSSPQRPVATYCLRPPMAADTSGQERSKPSFFPTAGIRPPASHVQTGRVQWVLTQERLSHDGVRDG